MDDAGDVALCAGMRTGSITVAYNGAPFCGFARQPGQLTVQGELEHALRLVFKRDVPTVCAGRTDAGVHARGQVVSFEMTDAECARASSNSFLNSMDALTHDGISVRAFDERPPGFSARFDARAREYRYFIACGRAKPIFMRDFSWHIPAALDVDAMRAAAAHLIGEHDFKSFCLAASAEGKPTCRNVHEVSFARQEVMGEPMLVMRVTGNAFLHSMVRTMVGTLVMVGRGKREPDWVRDVLAARDRKAAGENAPAQGLVFWSVAY